MQKKKNGLAESTISLGTGLHKPLLRQTTLDEFLLTDIKKSLSLSDIELLIVICEYALSRTQTSNLRRRIKQIKTKLENVLGDTDPANISLVQ
jgi:hypothetical protein